MNRKANHKHLNYGKGSCQDHRLKKRHLHNDKIRYKTCLGKENNNFANTRIKAGDQAFANVRVRTFCVWACRIFNTRFRDAAELQRGIPLRRRSVVGRGESGWCSDVTSTHGAWRHAGVRFLLPGVFNSCRIFFSEVLDSARALSSHRTRPLAHIPLFLQPSNNR